MTEMPTCDILDKILSVTAQCKCAGCGTGGASHLAAHSQAATTLDAKRSATHALYCAACCPVHKPKVDHLSGEVRATNGQQGGLFE